MEELGTREARDAWCWQVEQDIGFSEERGDGVPPGLLRVQKLENDIMNVVSCLSVFFSTTDTNPLRSSQLSSQRFTSSLELSRQIHSTLLREQRVGLLSTIRSYLKFSRQRVQTFG